MVAFRMQKSFNVQTSTGSYPVSVGRGLLKEMLSSHPDATIIIDERLSDRLPTTSHPVIALPATEAQKSLERMADVVLQLRGHKVGRSSLLLAIGGGIIQDVSTFVCSVYMRGVPWIYLPTTMLAMTDSCIGGKSSINVGGIKNLVGNIYPPQAVAVDTDFVTTLDASQVVGGLVEAAKICFARSDDAFLSHLALEPGFPVSPSRAESILLHSLDVKRWFIEIDEFDRRERLLLNYGHTFGHAIEAATDFDVPHGLAVALGVLSANHLAEMNGWLSVRGSAAAARLSQHMVGLVRQANWSPAHPMSLQQVTASFQNDKKHLPDAFRIVAPRGDGSLELVLLPRNADTMDSLAQGVTFASGTVGWPLVTG